MLTDNRSEQQDPELPHRQDRNGFEVRVGYSDDQAINTQLTRDVSTARLVAAEMRSIVGEVGSVLDADGGSGTTRVTQNDGAAMHVPAAAHINKCQS